MTRLQLGTLALLLAITEIAHAGPRLRRKADAIRTPHAQVVVTRPATAKPAPPVFMMPVPPPPPFTVPPIMIPTMPHVVIPTPPPPVFTVPQPHTPMPPALPTPIPPSPPVFSVPPILLPTPVLPPANADMLDLAKVRRKLAAKDACGLSEVAPGVIVRLDCTPYVPMVKATQHLSPAKARMLKQGIFRPWFFPKAYKRPIPARPAPVPIPPVTPPTPEPPIPTPLPPVPPVTPPVSPQALPDAIELRDHGLSGPVNSQGTVGACTAFAMTSVVDNALRRLGRQENVSPTHIWAGYGLPSLREAGDATIGRSLATFATLPYRQKDACRLARSPSEDCDDSLGVRKNSWRQDSTLVAALARADASGIVTVASVEKLHAPVDVDEVRTILASGVEILAAFRLGGDSWSNRRMNDGVIPDWTSTSSGHAVAIAGYRTTSRGRQYLIHNSWGEQWGDKGYGWISESMLKKHLKYAYRVKLQGELQARTDDDCGADELLDAVTGRCEKICAGDTRPRNGKCR